MEKNNFGSLIKGIVVAPYTDDPLHLNRVQVYIPALHGEYDSKRVGVSSENPENTEGDAEVVGKYPWAQCSVQMGLASVPPVESNVWIMFETNSTQFPVIIGMHAAGMTINDTGMQGTGFSGGSLAEIAAQIIFASEGGYTSVNWNDNGAISIGKLQWHANKARDLLKDIRSKNQSNFDSICSSSSLVSDLNKSWNTWKNYSSSCPAGIDLKEVLGTNESKTVQDETAIKYVQDYITNIQNAGITDAPSIVYFADMANQGPAYAYKMAGRASGMGLNTLDAVHKATLNGSLGVYGWINDSKGKPRRVRTYDAIKNAESEGKFVQNNLTGMFGNTGSGLMMWPVPTVSFISSKWGYRGPVYNKNGKQISGGKHHNGIDIAGAGGSKIYAAHAGTVIQNGYYNGYGNWCVIEGNGYATLYAHMQSPTNLAKGTAVQKGTYIGPMGTTGNSTGNHLHFTVYQGTYAQRKDIDPLTVVTKPS